MDIYHIFADLAPGESDMVFADNVNAYLGDLQANGDIASFRLMRRKLGLGPEGMGEFHIMIEVEDLAQLDRAFGRVSARAGAIEALHHGVNAMARNTRFALYRDFPDPHRVTGEERF